MLYVCPQGCVLDIGMSKPHPGDCEAGHGRYQYAKALGSNGRKPLATVSPKRQAEEEAGAKKPRRRSGLKQTQRRETAAERKARLHFNKTVKSWPCWFGAERPCGGCDGKGEINVYMAGSFEGIFTCPDCDGDGRHHCAGRKDAHHLLPERFTRKMFQAVLPEDQFVAILHNPLIGAPLCRKAHDQVEAGFDRIYFEDLSEECLEYVGSLPDFCLIELERLCPKRADLQPSPTTEGSVATPEGVA